MVNQTSAFHYPPALFDLLVKTIPVLCKSKKDVLIFFRGAGIPDSLFADVTQAVNIDKSSINKYEMARTILLRINEDNDQFLSQRRELLKRVSEFESFGNCWPNEQYTAQGLVTEIKKIIQTKDAFTRMEIERDKELAKHRKLQQQKTDEINERSNKAEKINKEFGALFAIKNPQERGKQLEGVLNSLFAFYGILIREAFTISGDQGEGIIEQIDGVIEVDNQVYFVEMKWLSTPVSNKDVYQHLGRIFSRPRPNGIFISASGYTDSALIASKDALTRNGTIVLMNLEEFSKILLSKTDLVPYMREKILKSLIDKNPYFLPSIIN